MKAMRKRDVTRKLKKQDCWLQSTDGDHEKWRCPCGKHFAAVPDHQFISPGVLRNIVATMQCLPKGWLQ